MINMDKAIDSRLVIVIWFITNAAYYAGCTRCRSDLAALLGDLEGDADLEDELLLTDARLLEGSSPVGLDNPSECIPKKNRHM